MVGRLGAAPRRIGHGASGSSRWLIGVATGAIALVMLCSPMSAAAAVGPAAHPRFPTTVAPQNDYGVSGCGQTRLPHPWYFHPKTGVGGSTSTGRATACRNAVVGLGQESEAYGYGGFTIGVALPSLHASTSNVSASVSARWDATLTASDGGTTRCDAALSTTSYDDIYWGWNYTASGGFGSTAYYENYSYIGYGGNSSYVAANNTAAVPNPFSLSSTTYLAYYYGHYTYGDCESFAYGYLGTWAYLTDLTTGTSVYESGASIGVLVDGETVVYNQTDYGCYASFYWYGPTNYSYGNTTTYCYNDNVTRDSYVYALAPSYLYTPGTNNTQSWTASGATSGAIWFNGPFTPHDHYELELTFYAAMYVENSWPKGFAGWAFKMGTTGTGFDLTSVVIT